MGPGKGTPPPSDVAFSVIQGLIGGGGEGKEVLGLSHSFAKVFSLEVQPYFLPQGNKILATLLLKRRGKCFIVRITALASVTLMPGKSEIRNTACA